MEPLPHQLVKANSHQMIRWLHWGGIRSFGAPLFSQVAIRPPPINYFHILCFAALDHPVLKRFLQIVLNHLCTFIWCKLRFSHFYTVSTSGASSFLLFRHCSIPLVRRSQNRARWIFQDLNFFYSIPLFGTSSNGYRMFGCTRVSMLRTNSFDAKLRCPSEYFCDVQFLKLSTTIWMP